MQDQEIQNEFEALKTLRYKLFFEPVHSKEELAQWIKTFLKVDLPDTHVDELSTSDPMTFIWCVYETFLYDQGPHRQIVASSRNSMKSLSASIIELLAMVHFRRKVLHFAAVKDQATVCLKYAKSFMRLPELENHFDRDNKNEIALTNLPTNSFTSRSDATLNIIATTIKQANSKRSSLIVGDEIDQCSEEILSEISPVSDPSGAPENFNPIFVYLSSRKLQNGPVQTLISEAESPGAEDIILHKWSQVDFMKKCDIVDKDIDKKNVPVWINNLDLQTIWDQDEFNNLSKNQTVGFINATVYEKCKTCKAFLACQGRAPDQTGESPSLRTRKFVSSLLATIRDPAKIISQVLNLRPESSGLVFANFNRIKHVKNARDAYEWITGTQYNPYRLSDEQVKLALVSRIQKERSTVIPGKYELANAMLEHGWKINFGVDFGYSPDPATCVVTGFHSPSQRCFILHTEAENFYADSDWAKYIKERVVNILGIMPSLVCPDVGSSPSSPKFFSKERLPCRAKKPPRIETGVSQIRSLLWDPSVQEPRLAVLNDPSNEFFIKEMMSYQHRSTQAGGWDFSDFEDGNNHSIDALRYSIDPFIQNTQITMARTSVRQNEDIFKELEQKSLLGTINDIEQAAYVKSQIEATYKEDFGLTGIFDKVSPTGLGYNIVGEKPEDDKKKSTGIIFSFK